MCVRGGDGGVCVGVRNCRIVQSQIAIGPSVLKQGRNWGRHGVPHVRVTVIRISGPSPSRGGGGGGATGSARTHRADMGNGTVGFLGALRVVALLVVRCVRLLDGVRIRSGGGVCNRSNPREYSEQPVLPIVAGC